MKKFLKVLLALIIIIIIGLVIFFNLPKSNIKKKDAAFAMKSHIIYQAFNKNEAAANKKYLGKVFEIEGKILDKEIDRRDAGVVRLSQNKKSQVMITLSNDQTTQLGNYNVGDMIKVKAKCNGFIQEVVFDKGIIIE